MCEHIKLINTLLSTKIAVGRMSRLLVITLALSVIPLMGSLSDLAQGSVDLEIAYGTFSLIVNGEPMDFSQSKYQSKSELISFEDGEGYTVHIYDPDATMGDFSATTMRFPFFV